MKLEQQIKDLKKQLKDLSNLDEILEKQAVKDQSQPNEKKRKRREKLFKYSFVETPLEVKLSDELSGNLKNLKPEGNLYYDQMLSLQSSGKIESRVPVNKKRKYTKKSLKNGLTKISSKVEFFSYTCCFHFCWWFVVVSSFDK